MCYLEDDVRSGGLSRERQDVPPHGLCVEAVSQVPSVRRHLQDSSQVNNRTQPVHHSVLKTVTVSPR